MDLTLKEIRQETPTVISLIFNKPDSFTFKPGQFLRWTYPVDPCDERCNSRSFSISSSPTEDYLMMTTRLGPSALKKALPQLQNSSIVQILGPMGRFILDESQDPIVMLVGGVGITPLRSMIKYILDTKSTRPITLLYSNTTAEEIAFKSEFDEWSANYLTLRVEYTITKPEESKTSWTGTVGRINEELIKKHLINLNGAQYYTSGPLIMVQAMKELLKKLNVEEPRIHAEIFPGY